MFSKDQKPKNDSVPTPPSSGTMSPPVPSTPSIISADLHITGDLKSNSDIQIDGRIDGDVMSRSVTVGESAEVNGTVVCDSIRVCGRLSGEVRANAVVIAKSARVSGDIAHKSLEIEAGASLEGGIRRLEGDAMSSSDKGAGKSAKEKGSSVTKLSEAASGGAAPRTGTAAAL